MTGYAAVLGGLVLSLTALLHWLPTWRREGLWFSVTVAPGFDATSEGRRALVHYRIALWGLAIVATGCVVAAAGLGVTALAPAGVLVETVGASVAFAVVRRRLLPFAVQASGDRSATLSVDPEALPGGVAVVIVPLGVLGATALYLRANWDRLPVRVPVHWGIDGTPNGWADRTWHGVYGPLFVTALISVFIILMAEAILHASPRARVSGTEAWTRRFRRAALLLMVAGVWAVSAMTSAFALMPLFRDVSRPLASVRIIPAVMLLSLAPFMWQLVRAVRAPGSRSDGTPDACWKFGLFYYNPDDSALVVEKRFGVGYTLNFGNRTMWWILGLAALALLLVKTTP
jgi:uncharacterized membrane protein